jgi:hypothetical protein
MYEFSTAWPKRRTDHCLQICRIRTELALHGCNSLSDHIDNAATPATMERTNCTFDRIIEQYSLAVCMLYHQANPTLLGYQGINAGYRPVFMQSFREQINLFTMHLIARKQMFNAHMLFHQLPVLLDSPVIVTHRQANIKGSKRRSTHSTTGTKQAISTKLTVRPRELPDLR